MKAQTKRRIKAAIERMDAALWIIVRRVALRWARKLIDAADERVQAAHAKLREEIAAINDLSDQRDRQHPALAVHSTQDMLHRRTDVQRPLAAGPESDSIQTEPARH